MKIQETSFDDVMRKYFEVEKGLGMTDALCKESYYGFCAKDVVCAHFHKVGFGACVFFRLRDGRVIDSVARQHNPNPELYDQTIH